MSRRLYFDSDEWEMLTQTLIHHITALKLHTAQPLMRCVPGYEEVQPTRRTRGKCLFALISGSVHLQISNVVLATLCGFPISLSDCSDSVRAFQHHALYERFMVRILTCHVREHTQVKSSESHRSIREPEATHVDRLMNIFNRALSWIESEGRDGAQPTHELLCEVFDLVDALDSEVSTVLVYRKQFALELFRAVCNFIMRYLFCTGGTQQVHAIPKKLFVSFVPVREALTRSQASLKTPRRAVPATVGLGPNPQCHISIPIDCTAWNLVHRGTSELVPLMLNLFGFENLAETALLRQHRDETEIASALQSLQADLDALHEIRCGERAVGCRMMMSQEAPCDRERFLFSATLADCIAWQASALPTHSHKASSCPRTPCHLLHLYGSPFSTLIAAMSTGQGSMIPKSVVSTEILPTVYGAREIGLVVATPPSVCDDVVPVLLLVAPSLPTATVETSLSAVGLRERQRAFGTLLATTSVQQSTQYHFCNVIVVAAVNINRLAGDPSGPPVDLCKTFVDCAPRCGWEPQTGNFLASAVAHLADRLEILQAAVHVVKTLHDLATALNTTCTHEFNAMLMTLRQGLRRTVGPSHGGMKRLRYPAVMSSGNFISSILKKKVPYSDVRDCVFDVSVTDMELQIMLDWYSAQNNSGNDARTIKEEVDRRARHSVAIIRRGGGSRWPSSSIATCDG